jgi:hypothetical protein
MKTLHLTCATALLAGPVATSAHGDPLHEDQAITRPACAGPSP